MNCSPEGTGERARAHPPLLLSYLPACACLCKPAAFPPIILTADPCLMAMSGLQHHDFSDCCTLCSLTWQLKMIYKWSFRFQIESSKRLWYLPWYQRNPAISAAVAFAFTVCLSPGFYIRCLSSKDCFVRALCRARAVSGAESASWGQRPVPVRRRLVGSWGCYRGVPVSREAMQEDKWGLIINHQSGKNEYNLLFSYCQSFPHRGGWAWDWSMSLLEGIHAT